MSSVESLGRNPAFPPSSPNEKWRTPFLVWTAGGNAGSGTFHSHSIEHLDDKEESDDGLACFYSCTCTIACKTKTNALPRPAQHTNTDVLRC